MTLPTIRPEAVVVVVVSALPAGPHVDAGVEEEWWAGASKDHRKAAFIAAVEAIGRLGMRVIPEEYGPEAGRDLDDLPEDLTEDL